LPVLGYLPSNTAVDNESTNCKRNGIQGSGSSETIHLFDLKIEDLAAHQGLFEPPFKMGCENWMAIAHKKSKYFLKVLARDSGDEQRSTFNSGWNLTKMPKNSDFSRLTLSKTP